MYLTEYTKVTIDNFMGLWDRGSLDDVPLDHSPDCLNVAFSRKREVMTRPTGSLGRNVNGNVIRQFIACFNNDTLIPIHADDKGNIWRDDNNTILLTVSGMVDADFLNMNNLVFIAPMFSSIPGGSQYSIYVWTGPSATPRLAAGAPPPISVASNDFSITAGTGGHTGPGWYGVSISYVMDTGFVTAPGALGGGIWPTVQLPNNTSRIVIGNLNTFSSLAPPGAIALIVWVTLGQQDLPGMPGSGSALAANAQLFQYSQIPFSNVTNPYYANFYDTDLTVSADNLPGNGNVNDALAFLPAGLGSGSVALAKYHGRLIIIGTRFIQVQNINDPSLALQSVWYVDDRVWISNSGQIETFDELTGYVDVQSEFDGNFCRTAFELFGVLYICKAVGTYSTQDTGSEPGDPTNPWRVNMIDGGIGAYHHSIGTITGSQPSLSFNSVGFLANRNGLFLFSGSVQRPELTWKIRAIWGRITHGAEYNIRVVVDIYSDLFYVLLPVDGNVNPSLLLVGDYSLGLDYQNIRWSMYTFPWVVNDIMMGYYGGDTGGGADYYLRMGTNGAIYKLDNSASEDEGTTYINNYYQTSPLAIGDPGPINVFRFIRYRLAGSGTLVTTVTDQGRNTYENAPNVIPMAYPGNYKDFGIQINFVNEKMLVRFGTQAGADNFRMSRVDVFGKNRWPTRPNG